MFFFNVLFTTLQRYLLIQVSFFPPYRGDQSYQRPILHLPRDNNPHHPQRFLFITPHSALSVPSSEIAAFSIQIPVSPILTWPILDPKCFSCSATISPIIQSKPLRSIFSHSTSISLNLFNYLIHYNLVSSSDIPLNLILSTSPMMSYWHSQ